MTSSCSFQYSIPFSDFCTNFVKTTCCSLEFGIPSKVNLGFLERPKTSTRSSIKRLEKLFGEVCDNGVNKF